jgi:hypothetical protein
MPALSRGQENTPSILNWFITVDGVLTNAYEVDFQIFDIAGGLPGTQIFPITPGDWEDVTSLPGNFAVGSYYAYDNTNSKGFTPAITASIGTHRINWRWKISDVAPYQTDSEDFEVLVQSAGSTADTYITIQDVRDAGLSDVTIYPDVTVLSYIETWQAFLERACRQWFVPKTIIMKFDGTDSDAIHFGVPIISVEYMKINGSTTPLDVNLYEVYNSMTYPDDRRNPRIKLIDAYQYRDIFTQPGHVGDLLFRKGRRNNEIKGVFGFVESDMSTPKLIKRALLKLVVEKITKPIYVSDPSTLPVQPPPILGSILEEETDGHRIKYAQPGGEVSKRSPYLTGITQDAEIIEIIKLYRNPIGCATPQHNSFR